MDFIGKQGFIWWKGVVEDRKDPLKLGRVKIRIIGWHTDDKNEMPTESLPWSYPCFSFDIGKNVVGLKEGDWVFGFFWDDRRAQEPVVLGKYLGIPEQAANPEVGFFDPTPEEELTPEKQPRPPEYSPIPGSKESGEGTDTGRFSNPDVLPGANVAFGELQQEFDPKNYKWDVTHDGKYDANDAKAIIDANDNSKFAFGDPSAEDPSFQQELLPMSRYPLESELKEPQSSRLARNETIEKTIVQKKRANITSAETASHKAMGVGTDQAAEFDPFTEPETPYAAIYPFNHVYESESGHFRELDDTPQAERLHEYHRSGTFVEIHPDGTRVLKGVKKGFNIFIEDYYFSTGKSATHTAEENYLIRAGEIMNLFSGKDMNQDAEENRNISSGKDMNFRCGRSVYGVVEEDVRILVKGNFNLAVEGDIKIKAKGDYLLEAANIDAVAKGQHCLHGNEQVTTVTPITSLDGEIVGNIKAITAESEGPGPEPYIPCSLDVENDADNKDNLETSSSPKEGFILYGPAGDLWKPESDSDGKPVTLSFDSGGHTLYEALPTGELQEVEIQYKHADFSITTWKVVRPVHTKGKFIDRGVFRGLFEGDGRNMYRWSKSAKDYPTQMILNIAGRDYLLLDGAVRHEAFGDAYLGY